VRAAYAIPASTPVLGPWGGALDNAGELVRLAKPGDALPDSSIPYISVDHVEYDSSAPWPISPDGAGPTLQRVNSFVFGNDVANWASFAPTVGRLNFDTDGDGMPDSWETANGLNPVNAADGAGDDDGDGTTNQFEYRAGTDPRDRASIFRVESAAATGPGGAYVITFIAQAGRGYTVQWRSSLTTGTWQKVADVSPQGTTGPVQVTDPGSVGQGTRFYRVATPVQ
jgi:hypothetical protein